MAPGIFHPFTRSHAMKNQQPTPAIEAFAIACLQMQAKSDQHESTQTMYLEAAQVRKLQRLAQRCGACYEPTHEGGPVYVTFNLQVFAIKIGGAQQQPVLEARRYKSLAQQQAEQHASLTGIKQAALVMLDQLPQEEITELTDAQAARVASHYNAPAATLFQFFVTQALLAAVNDRQPSQYKPLLAAYQGLIYHALK